MSTSTDEMRRLNPDRPGVVDRLGWAYGQDALEPREAPSPTISEAARKAVLVNLAYRDGDRCTPSKARIVRDTGLSLSTVKYAPRDLELLGLIAREHRASGGRSKSNAYVLAYHLSVNDGPASDIPRGQSWTRRGQTLTPVGQSLTRQGVSIRPVGSQPLATEQEGNKKGTGKETGKGTRSSEPEARDDRALDDRAPASAVGRSAPSVGDVLGEEGLRPSSSGGRVSLAASGPVWCVDVFELHFDEEHDPTALAMSEVYAELCTTVSTRVAMLFAQGVAVRHPTDLDAALAMLRARLTEAVA